MGYLTDKLTELSDLIDRKVDVPIINGLLNLGMFACIIIFILWFIWGYIRVFFGYSFSWKFRTVLFVLWIIAELAYSIGTQNSKKMRKI